MALTRKSYPDLVVKLINENKELLSVAGLERLAGFDKNTLRKSLLGTRPLHPREAAKLCSVIHSLGFSFSSLNLTEKEVNTLPYR